MPVVTKVPKLFKVVVVSENTNSFGLKQMVLLAKDGEAYKVCANSLNVRKEGDTVVQELTFSEEIGQESKVVNRAFALNFEIPERLNDKAPQTVIDEVWS